MNVLDHLKVAHQAVSRVNGIDIGRWLRAARVARVARGRDVVVTLRNGLQIELEASQYITSRILRHGCFDPVVAEALVRLSSPGEVHVDVGANVGYTSAMMAAVAGPTGRVIAFEPAPRTFARLSRNAQSINAALGAAVIDARSTAVGAQAGTAFLEFPAHIDASDGLTVVSATRRADRSTPSDERHAHDRVALITMDEFFEGRDVPSLVKIDVEGAEAAVIEGMRQSLERGPTTVIYEENSPFPGPAGRLLMAMGFGVWRLDPRGPLGLLGVTASDPATARTTLPSGFEPDTNYVAAREPARIRRAFDAIGWECA